MRQPLLQPHLRLKAGTAWDFKKFKDMMRIAKGHQFGPAYT